MQGGPVKLGTVLAGLAAVTLYVDAAAATDCSTAAERGQTERNAGRLLSARDAFTTCSQAACVPEIREYCTRWLAEVNHGLPSVVVTLRENGRELPDLHLEIDGHPVASHGYDATPLDPGRHHVRAVSDRGAAEADFVVNEGEGVKAVSLTLPPRRPAPPDAAPPSRWTPPVLGLGAVGVTAAVLATAFLIVAVEDKSTLDARCGQDPTKCGHSDRTTGRAYEAVTEISAGIAVLSLGAATWLALHPPQSSPSQVTARGGIVSLEASF
jgi:hypothetical protein